MERLIDNVIFLAKKILAFGNCWFTAQRYFSTLFKLLAKRNPVFNELRNRIIRVKSKQHYLSKDIQNELINLIAQQAEKVLPTQLKRVTSFAVILDCV